MSSFKKVHGDKSICNRYAIALDSLFYKERIMKNKILRVTTSVGVDICSHRAADHLNVSKEITVSINWRKLNCSFTFRGEITEKKKMFLI